MTACQKDMTLREALADPLIRAVIRADRVNAVELQTALATIGDKLRKRNRAGGSSLPARCVFDR